MSLIHFRSCSNFGSNLSVTWPYLTHVRVYSPDEAMSKSRVLSRENDSVFTRFIGNFCPSIQARIPYDKSRPCATASCVGQWVNTYMTLCQTRKNLSKYKQMPIRLSSRSPFFILAFFFAISFDFA